MPNFIQTLNIDASCEMDAKRRAEAVLAVLQVITTENLELLAGKAQKQGFSINKKIQQFKMFI